MAGGIVSKFLHSQADLTLKSVVDRNYPISKCSLQLVRQHLMTSLLYSSELVPGPLASTGLELTNSLKKVFLPIVFKSANIRFCNLVEVVYIGCED